MVLSKRFSQLFSVFFSVFALLYLSAHAEFYSLNPQETSYCDIVCTKPNAVTVSVSVPYLVLDKRIVDGVEYSYPILEGYRNNLKHGDPAVLVTYFNLLTGSNPTLDIRIIEQETTVIENVLLYPTQPEPAIRPDYQNEEAPFTKNNARYETDAVFPSALAGVNTIMEYRGNYITSVWLTPVQYNPVTKQLTIYTKLKAVITNIGAQATVPVDRSSALSLLKNTTVNANPMLRNSKVPAIDDDDADDVIIITKDTYKAAAETLAVWQRMKGYDVKVVTKSSWTQTAVKTAVADFYNATTPKPAHMLIIGDNPDVPTNTKNNNPGDLYYVCFGGNSDYVADMGRGRLSVSSADEAMKVVKKIIAYEKTPPTKESFFKTAMSAAQFQTRDGSTERWAFTYCVETSIRHLKEKYGYNIVRHYKVQNNGSPKYWDPSYVGYLSNGNKKPVPKDIQKPNYPWTATGSDVVKSMDEGVFLAAHYDHGLENGWSTPSFNTNSVNQLKNNELLPVVYSINCLSGAFHQSRTCFAEALIRKTNGGAIGVIAATKVTYAGGANDALVMGLIDASFPRNLYEPKKTVNASKRDTTYILGDIFNHGLIRHGECCSNTFKLHSEIYNLHGDPTTEMWTDVPQQITASHKPDIAFSEASFTVSGLNVGKGMASIVDKNTGTLAGKKLINGSTVTIPVKNFTKEGEAFLTIRSHNYRPYIATLKVFSATGINDQISHHGNYFIPIRTGKRIVMHIACTANAKIGLQLFNLKGQELFNQTVYADNAIDLSSIKDVKAGFYLLDVSVNGERIKRAEIVELQ